MENCRLELGIWTAEQYFVPKNPSSHCGSHNSLTWLNALFLSAKCLTGTITFYSKRRPLVPELVNLRQSVASNLWRRSDCGSGGYAPCLNDFALRHCVAMQSAPRFRFYHWILLNSVDRPIRVEPEASNRRNPCIRLKTSFHPRFCRSRHIQQSSGPPALSRIGQLVAKANKSRSALQGLDAASD